MAQVPAQLQLGPQQPPAQHDPLAQLQLPFAHPWHEPQVLEPTVELFAKDMSVVFATDRAGFGMLFRAAAPKPRICMRVARVSLVVVKFKPSLPARAVASWTSAG